MSTYNWLQLFGVPAICGAITMGLAVIVWKQIVSIKALKLGMQAILRDRLYQAFNYCSRNGFASNYDRENFDNMFKQYHSLGANGVMNDVRDKFMKLPIKEETRQ